MTALYILTAILFAFELSTFITYGGFVPKHLYDIYMNLDERTLRLNQFDQSILSLRSGYITNVPFSLIVKYHIDGIGTVPRWSKLHKRINKYFAITIKNSITP